MKKVQGMRSIVEKAPLISDLDIRERLSNFLEVLLQLFVNRMEPPEVIYQYTGTGSRFCQPDHVQFIQASGNRLFTQDNLHIRLKQLQQIFCMGWCWRAYYNSIKISEDFGLNRMNTAKTIMISYCLGELIILIVNSRLKFITQREGLGMGTHTILFKIIECTNIATTQE